MKSLTVAQAAKRLNACVRRVYFEHVSYELLKNGIPQARLVPVNGGWCNSHELADDLAAMPLSLDDRRAISAALRKGRKHLKRLRNPWA